MKQVKFTLPIKEVEEGAPPQMGLTFITYLTRQIHLEPGESKLETIRDTAIGFYEDWSDADIKTYYEERYSEFGLEVEIVADGPNFP